MAFSAIAMFFSMLLSPSNTTAFAQGTDFSSDPDEFVKQIADVFKTAQDKQRAKEFVLQLRNFMRQPVYDESRKQQIIADCNLLRKRKARAFPEYYTYINTMITLCDENSPIADRNYNVWREVLGEKLRTKSISLQKIVNYLNATNAYIELGALSKTNNMYWKTDAPNVSFRNDGAKLYIDVPKSRLVCIALGDSIEVFETTGVVDFDEKKWLGESGVVTWERCDLPRATTNAEFGEYKIDLSKSFFNIDSVKFVNKDYFDYPLYGRVEHKVVQRKSALGLSYPKFYTKDDQRREVKNIFEGIDYEGGFSQIGKKFQGSGTAQNPAVLSVFRKDTLFIVARALSFAFLPDRLEGSNTRVNIILNDGEIQHPGLRFRFDNKLKEITMLRGGDGIEKSNYFDTFHQVTFDVEQVKWKIGSDEMSLGMVDGASRGLARFESIDYYRQAEYNDIQGMAMVHPFQIIKDFYKYNGGYSFDCESFAQYSGMDVHQIRQQMLTYSYDNFVDYDEVTDEVTPTKRLFNYLDNRLAEMEAVDERKIRNPKLKNPRLADVDYDVMIFESRTESDNKYYYASEPINGILDLRNYDIKLYGVDNVAISDFQNVEFRPANGEIRLKKNRDFEFNGVVNAGMAELKGDNFYFSYENYNIELKHIESLNMKVYSGGADRYGAPEKVDVMNTIHELTGYIQIDKPNNKSGLRGRDPKYPELTSTGESKVYYDAEYIQDGQYTRDKFYFTVDPFVFNDMNNIRYSNTKFDGVLTSGIFPDIRHELVIRREDNSLGFVAKSPDEGYPTYGDKATFIATIDLSNAGLRGGGDLKYEKATATSTDFTFLPDLALAKTNNFYVEKTTRGVVFPSVQLGPEQAGENEHGKMQSGTTDMEFYPNEDKMNLYNTFGKFRMFPNEDAVIPTEGYDCVLDGGLSVTPRGLRGLGEATLPHSAKLEAAIMDFTDHSFTTDTTYFAQYMFVNDVRKLASDGLRRDLVNPLLNEDREYSRKWETVYNNARGRTNQETNDALTQNEVFYRIGDAKDDDSKSLVEYLNRKCMIANVDFESRIGAFTYKNDRGGEKYYNTIRFKTWVTEFTWDMVKNEQTIGKHGAVPGLLFECTKVEPRDVKDTLRFNVPYAVYDATNGIMRCEEVKHVNCADAKINLSDNGLMTIRSSKNNKVINIDRLTDAKIDLKTDSTFHQLYNAYAEINGADDYKGGGQYDFFNKDKVKYTFEIDSVKVSREDVIAADGSKEKMFVSTARGTVSRDVDFDKDFTFRGQMEIKGWRKLLEWRGGVRMLHEAEHSPKTYAYFESVINVDKVRIPVGDKLLVYKKDPKARHEIFKDFFIRKDSTHAYSAFAEVRKDNSDISIVSASGLLYYNRYLERYDITTRDKMFKGDTIGSVLSYVPKEDAILGFGNLHLGVSEMMGSKTPVMITSAGNIRDDRATDRITVNTLMNLDFGMNNEVATLLYNKLLATTAPSCDTASHKYELRLQELYDTTEIKDIKATRWTGVDKKTKLLPDNFELFTFDNVAMTWLTSEKAYVVDTTVNLMMVRGRNINKKVRLKGELVATTQSRGVFPLLYLMMTTDDGFWLYMNLMRDPTNKKWTMNIRSSDEEFNELLAHNPYKNGGFNCIRVDGHDKRFINFRDNFNAKELLEGKAAQVNDLEDEEIVAEE